MTLVQLAEWHDTEAAKHRAIAAVLAMPASVAMVSAEERKHVASAAACRVVAKAMTPGFVCGGGTPVAELEEKLEPDLQQLEAALAAI